MAPSIDSINAITLHVIKKRMADNVFLSNPTAAWFLMSGRVEIESGGMYIQEPLMYQKNSTTKSYSKWDLLDNTPQEEMTGATYNWKQMAASTTISGLEELQNSGEAAVLKLLKKKLENTEFSLNEFLDEKLHADFTTKTAKDFLGLDELIEDVSPPAATVGGISRSTETWWRNKYATGTLATQTNDMISFYNTCTEGRTSPDYITTTQALYENFEIQNAGKLRLQNTTMMNIGYQNLIFKGATMVYNRHCIDGNMYFINSQFIRMVIHKDRNFKPTPWKTPINQDGQVSQILVAGNLTLNNSRFQGVLKVA